MKDQHLEKKNRQLDESASQISDLEETNFKAFDEINKLRANVKFIERQWEKSAYEIEDNIMAQCQVICLETDFGEVSLDKHVVDGHIEVAPLEEGGNDREPSTPLA